MVACNISGRAYLDLDSELPSSLDGPVAAGLVQWSLEDYLCVAHTITSLQSLLPLL
jgi:hypothetical protein